ncbi:udp/adp-sugar pyrophosphatase [Holotrichia oblita]|uniref:Udp/adp-sugar pyrophosphatase n=1 Tax=Holotrichia oblita TaxID=644536 RepID=A0ACB9SWP8_HOLOL|nr:udp/adp-sugar pyrophosphatase [Holotrichia oblita]
MQDIKNIVVRPLESTRYIKPISVHYILNGKSRISHIVRSSHCVAVIIYNISKNELVFVKQFRASRYFSNIAKNDRCGQIDPKKYSPDLGVALELCAGIVDKEASLEQIAAEEILEECGYKVNVSHLEKIHSFPASEYTTIISHIYYCEVTEALKINEGGGIGDELIEVINIPVTQVQEMLFKENSLIHPNLMYCIYWFLKNKCELPE